jgi:transposase
MLGKKGSYGNGSLSNLYDFSASADDPADLEAQDGETRSRLKAVLMYEKGHSVEHIMAETGCSRSSLLSWYRAYRQQGVKGLNDCRQGGNNAKLADAQVSDLIGRLQGRTPRDILGHHTAMPEGKLWTVEDLYNVIWQWYGVKYKSRTSYYNLLKKCVPRDRRSE